MEASVTQNNPRENSEPMTRPRLTQLFRRLPIPGNRLFWKPRLRLEPIVPAMAETLVRIHHHAVHGGEARRYYSPAILDAWSPPVTRERVREFRQKLIKGPLVGRIAYLNQEAVGFGILNLSQKRLGALYVKAGLRGKQVGGRLLAALERIAVEKGYDRLALDASLNAAPFYRKQGYTALGPDIFRLPGGVEMACVNMEKTFQNKNIR